MPKNNTTHKQPDHTPDTPKTQHPNLANALHTLRQLGPVVGALAIISLTLPALVGFLVLGGSIVKADSIKSFLDPLGPGAPYAAAAIFALLTGCALAPTYAFSFATGAIFHEHHFLVPAAVAMSAVTAGSMIGYAIATILARKRVMHSIDADPRAKAIRAALLDRSLLTETSIITLIRIPPNSPFALTNFTLAATRANPIAYLVGTALGIAPRTLFAAWIGHQAGDIAKLDGAKPKAAVIIGLVVAVLVFITLYRLFTKWAREALQRHLDLPTTPSDPTANSTQ